MHRYMTAEIGRRAKELKIGSLEKVLVKVLTAPGVIYSGYIRKDEQTYLHLFTEAGQDVFINGGLIVAIIPTFAQK